jgi:hypothetical protein
VVEPQLQEGLARFRPSGRNRHELLREILAQEIGDEARGVRGELGRLEDRAVPRGEGPDPGTEGAEGKFQAR